MTFHCLTMMECHSRLCQDGAMAQTQGKARTTRRTEALSKEVVAAAAVDLLDEHGERGFTFKLLTERLRTGAGAVYWHVANKDELVALAADRVIGDALVAGAGVSADHGTDPEPDPDPDPTPDAETRLRALALAVYDTLEQHQWAAAHVTAQHGLLNGLHLLDRIGTLITDTKTPNGQRFAVATAIFNYVTGVTAHDIARATEVSATTTRDAYLARQAERWAALDPRAFPFLSDVTADLRDHDDRDQFVAGLDLLLAGLRAQPVAGFPEP